jgi:hypothetical protein
VGAAVAVGPMGAKSEMPTIKGKMARDFMFLGLSIGGSRRWEPSSAE